MGSAGSRGEIGRVGRAPEPSALGGRTHSITLVGNLVGVERYTVGWELQVPGDNFNEAP